MGVRTKKLTCRLCGEAAPRHYMVGSVCYSCHLDRYIPPGYEPRERYRGTLWRHLNATRRPPLGVWFLDQGRGNIRRPAIRGRLPRISSWC